MGPPPTKKRAAPAAAQPAADPIAGRLAAIAAAYGTADPAGLDRSRRRALAAALTGESLTILAGRPDLVDPLRAALERTAPQAAPEVLARLAAALPGYAARLAPAPAAVAAPVAVAMPAPAPAPAMQAAAAAQPPPAAAADDGQRRAAQRAYVARLGGWLAATIGAEPGRLEEAVAVALAQAPRPFHPAVVGPAVAAHPDRAARILAAAGLAPAPSADWPRPAEGPVRLDRPLPAGAGPATIDGGSLAPGPAATTDDGIDDPLSGLNRFVLAINNTVDFVLLRPVAWTYGALPPNPVSRALRNVAGNLNGPAVVANGLLQGEIEQAGSDAGRFAVNSTAGGLGFFDVASHIGLPPNSADFGETLHRYGVPAGPYLMLPLLGPTTLRDGVGRGVDTALDPMTWLLEAPVSYVVTGTEAVVARERLLQPLDDLKSESVDFYSALRSFYYQRRAAELAGAGPAAGPASEPASSEAVDALFDATQ